METVKLTYTEYFPAYTRTLKNLTQDVECLLEDYTKEYNIRHKNIEGRIKELPSIINKMHKKRYKQIHQLDDIVGVKIVVNNIQDANNMCNILEKKFKSLTDYKCENYIDTPKVSGYRAIHLNFKYIVEVKHQKVSIPAEIQIKSIAQDLWSTLSHIDIYKGNNGEIPEIISKFTSTLGALLNIVDTQAQHIRDHLEQKVILSRDFTFNSDGNVDREVIAKIILDESGYEISEQDYFCLAQCLERNDVSTAHSLRKLIRSNEIRDEIVRLFSEYDLPEPSILDFIVYGACVYFDYESTEEIDTQMLEERIKEDHGLSDVSCERCERMLTNDEVDSCGDNMDEYIHLCADCLSEFRECPRCGTMTENSFFCDNCSDWIERQ